MRLWTLLLTLSFSLLADEIEVPPVHQNMYDYLEQHGHPSSLDDPWGYFMTGDWQGARSYLLQHGFLLSASYVADMVGNPDGGKARGFAYSGSFGLEVNLDFERACHVYGLELFTSLTWRTGTSLTQDKIGNQFSVQQNFGSQIVKFGELYLKERLLNDRLILQAGRLAAGNYFLLSPLYGQFMNNALCGNPISIFINIPSFTGIPTAVWGAYLSCKPIPELYLQCALFNANPKVGLNKYHGLNFTFKSTNGVIWITEWTALVNQRPSSKGMPGNYKMGFMYQTGNAQVFKSGMIHGDYCAYLLIDQMIYRSTSPRRSVTPFVSLLVSPNNRNLLPLFIDGGVVFQGPFAKRPDDSINIGFAYGRYSSGLVAQSAEIDLELNYWWQINGWSSVTPTLQYIINPKGLNNIQNAFVMGTQIGFSL